jgi:hypothetical protein
VRIFARVLAWFIIYCIHKWRELYAKRKWSSNEVLVENSDPTWEWLLEGCGDISNAAIQSYDVLPHAGPYCIAEFRKHWFAAPNHIS